MAFVVAPWLFDVLLCFLPSVLPLRLDAAVSIDVVSGGSFLSHVQTAAKSTRNSLHFCSRVFVLSSGFHRCAYMAICSCLLSALSIRALSILIRIVLNAQPDHANIPAMSALMLSLQIVFAF